MKLIVNDSCIKCGKCVRVCPSGLFKQEDSKVVCESTTGCIVCGHCVAVCPTGSVDHSEFPSEKVHIIDYDSMPTAEQVMLICKMRRSNRAFSKKVIPDTTLDLILEAAHRAPTASNMQQVEFTLVTSPEKLKAITNFTLGVFSTLKKRLNNPILKAILKPILGSVYKYVPIIERMERELEKGNDKILRGATAVIFIHTPKESQFGKADCNLAYQNGSLMAESLGVSQFYTGFVCMALKQSKDRVLEKMLGIEGTIHAGMALGIPSFRYAKYIDRKDIKVNKI